jgi:hypothetical protein
MTSPEYADALSRYAEDYLTTQGELLDDTTAQKIRITANAPYAIHVNTMIQAYNDQRTAKGKLPEDQWQHYNDLKQYAVWYNQTISSYMYDHDDDSMGAISQATVDTALGHFAHDPHHAEATMKQVLRGARTEAAARHFLEDSHVPVRPATIEEDLRGADLVVTIANRAFSIDIKSSLDQLARSAGSYDFANTGNQLYYVEHAQGKRDAKIMLFPAFTDADLGDALRLDPETTASRGNIVAVQLQRAINELQ